MIKQVTCKGLLFDFLNRHLEQTVRNEIALWFEWNLSTLKYSCRKTCQMKPSISVEITNKIFSHAVLKSGFLKYACAQFSWCYTKWHENNVIPGALTRAIHGNVFGQKQTLPACWCQYNMTFGNQFRSQVALCLLYQHIWYRRTMLYAMQRSLQFPNEPETVVFER